MLNVTEQKYLVCDTASRSTKRKDMLEIWGVWCLCPPGYAYVSQGVGHRTESQICTEKVTSKQV